MYAVVMPAYREPFLRFVVGHDDPKIGTRAGLFDVAYTLQHQPTTPTYQSANLEALLAWFKSNLMVPSRFSRSASKGAWRRRAKGVCWFKPTAREHIAKMYELAAIIEDLGHYTDVVKCARPGFIVYEDEFQIVTELFTDAAIR
jgi:hypothetical protein